jgi:hypothetical protein
MTQDTVKITLTRDSVFAGDDIDAPHEWIARFHPFSDALAFLAQIPAGYIASVRGIGHSWTAFLNGEPIATLRVTGIEPLVHELDLAGDNTLHFEYHSATY